MADYLFYEISVVLLSCGLWVSLAKFLSAGELLVLTFIVLLGRELLAVVMKLENTVSFTGQEHEAERSYTFELKSN